MPTTLATLEAERAIDPASSVLHGPLWRRALDTLSGAGEWIFGTLALIVGLSVLATIPVVQLLSLGYLLEASGRVARSGQLGAGCVGVRTAARLGRIALGIFLLMLP